MNKKEIEDEFYYFVIGSATTNFHAQLFRLILKADPINKSKLAMGFPYEVDLCYQYSHVKGWWEEFQKSRRNQNETKP